MPGRWSDERNWEGQGWRSRSRDDDREDRGYAEARSFDEDDEGSRYEGAGRDRVFGERDTGAQYNERDPRITRGGSYGGGRYGGGAYGSGGGNYGSGRSGGGRENYGRRPAWQDRDYQGVSPAMQQGEYELERNRRSRFGSQDYTRGGRYYGDDAHQPVYREEYGQGGRFYGREPRGYDAGYQDYEDRQGRETGRMASGGTGGYDYERGYGDGGREDRGRSGSEDFFRRAGERVASWFGGARDEVRRDVSGRGHRGRGPKGYQRPDERISDEAHQRLTDDPWVDASEISVSVSGAEVTLSGTVDSREAKHRAERCVEDISGVKHVQNNLRIEGGSFFTSPGRGFGDSVEQAQMRGEAPTDGDAATRTTTRRT
jgi:osmotically-inducible protein OsmY